MVLMLLFATNTFAADVVPAMKETVTSFYTVYLAVHPSGVPTENDLQQFQPHLSASLSKLLQDADKAEQKYKKKTKGQVPPLVEGDLFTSLFEGATAFKTLSCDVTTSSCLVELTYREPTPGASPVIWQDKVYLAKETRGWLVDDIEFLGSWEFMHKGLLQSMLQDVIKDSEGN
jgi:hypothetical protein